MVLTGPFSLYSRIVEWFIPRSERVPYVKASTGARWSLATAVAINILILSPLYFWYDYRLFSGVLIERSSVFLSLSAHISQTAGSLAMAVLYFVQRKHPFPDRWNTILLRVSLIHLLATTVIHALVGQSDAVRMSVYALVVIATVGVYYEPIWLTGALYIGSGLVIVVAAAAKYSDAYKAMNVQVNTMVVSVGAFIVYIAWDHARYRMYLREKRLEELNRLKDAVLRAAGHDLRAPYEQIQRLIPFLDQPDERFMEQRSRIRAQLDRLFRRAALVIDNIVAMNAGDSPSGSPYREEIIAVQELVSGVLKGVESEIQEKGVALECRVEEEVLVRGDPRMVRVVLLNLLNNAVKFSYPGSTIVIMADIREDSVEFSVADGGTGFDPSLLAGIEAGEWGHTTSGTAGEAGSGIGLSVCRTFLRHHGSALRIASRPGEGSTVFFPLPRFRGDKRK